MGLVLELGAVAPQHRQIVGQKAFNLSRLLLNDLLVPTTVIQIGSPSDRDIRQIQQTVSAPYAVRSTAGGEDGATASQAGRFASYLHVAAGELELAIGSCLAAYGSDLPDGQCAVIVQEMVAPAFAGVAFSVHPLTGQRHRVVIEATNGVADRMLSGEISGSQYCVDLQTHQIERIVVQRDGDIPDSVAIAVAMLAKQCEQLFQHPQDIEWAFDGQRTYVLQSRPITSSIPTEWHHVLAGDGDNLRTWKWNCSHTGHRAMSPLAAALLEGLNATGGPAIHRLLNGYHYMAFSETKRENLVTPEMWFSALEREWTWELEKLRNEDLAVLESEGLLSSLHNRLDVFYRFADLAFNCWAPFPDASVALLNDALLAHDNGVEGDSPRDFDELVYVLQVGLQTLNRRRDELLERLCHSVDPSGDLTRVLLHEYGDYLLHNFDIMMPTFGEDSALIDRFRGRLKDSARYQASKLEKQRVVARLQKDAHSPESISSAIAALEEHLRRCENDDYFLGCLGGQIRRICRLIGVKFDIGDDVFFLTFDDLRRLLVNGSSKQLQEAIRRGHEDYGRWLSMAPPPYIVSSQPDYGRSTSHLRDRELHGIAVCQGIVRGRAKVIQDSRGLKDVVEGDILVCSTFVPSMTFVIPALAGLATEFGIMNSHGAIVAREHRVPAVFDVRHLLKRVSNGDSVEVNGYAGTITLL